MLFLTPRRLVHVFGSLTESSFMKTFLCSLIAVCAFAGVSLAAPYTMLSGVSRYTKLENGRVSEDFGALYSSGEYTVFGNREYSSDEVVERGLTLATLDKINSKFVMDSSFLDTDLATAEGKERLSNYSVSTTKYQVMDFVTVYIVNAGGTTPKRPTINITATPSTIREGGKTAFIEVKLNKPVTSEVLLEYTLGGTAKLKADYTGPKAGRSMLVPRNKKSFRIPVKPVDDKIKELSENMVFQLAKNDGYIIGKMKSVTIRIKDND